MQRKILLIIIIIFILQPAEGISKKRRKRRLPDGFLTAKWGMDRFDVRTKLEEKGWEFEEPYGKTISEDIEEKKKEWSGAYYLEFKKGEEKDLYCFFYEDKFFMAVLKPVPVYYDPTLSYNESMRVFRKLKSKYGKPTREMYEAGLYHVVMGLWKGRRTTIICQEMATLGILGGFSIIYYNNKIFEKWNKNSQKKEDEDY